MKDAESAMKLLIDDLLLLLSRKETGYALSESKFFSESQDDKTFVDFYDIPSWLF